MVKLGIVARPARDLAAAARAAESAGFESIWLADHVVFPLALGEERGYPYSAGGAPPVPPETELFDAFTALAFMAAATDRIRVGTWVYVLPLRNPFTIARGAMTLDVLSGGRFSFGVGVGWFAAEFALLAQDFKSRARRSDEILEVLEVLWTQVTPEYHARCFDFGPVRFEPKPLQSPHPPIIVGGESPAALRRAARYGDGWGGLLHTPESVRGAIAELEARRLEFGRDHLPFEVTVGARVRDRGTLEAFAEAGVERVLLQQRRADASAVDSIERFAEMLL